MHEMNVYKICKNVLWWVGAGMFWLSSQAVARGTYQAPEEFIKEVFEGQPPATRTLWITADFEKKIKDILSHPYHQKRVRYWRAGERSAWVLEEIGKEELITTGVVVKSAEIELLRVLVYRESRGGEVRYTSFTDQFRGARLLDGNQLNRGIDGISGATLSVDALTRLARLALYLDARVRAGD